MSDLFEQLAAIQHTIWAHWQGYVQNTKMRSDRSISQADFDHWQRQINTPYADLTEKEKNSDREQVLRFWPLIEIHLTKLKEADQRASDLLDRECHIKSHEPENGGRADKILINLLNEVGLHQTADAYIKVPCWRE